MLANDEPLEKIKKYTGMSAQWLGRLKSEILADKNTFDDLVKRASKSLTAKSKKWE